MYSIRSRPIRMALLTISMAAMAGGCSEIVSASEHEVAIDTEWLGELMPRSQYLLSWPLAELHCRKFARRPALKDMRGGVVAYRCETAKPANNGKKTPD